MRELPDVDIEGLERVALLDLEGTLIPTEGSWPAVNERFGVTGDEDRELYEQYYLSDHAAWRAEIEQRWRDHGQASRSALQEALPEPEVPAVAHEIVAAFREQGACTMLVSGALDTYSRDCARRLGVDVHVPTWSVSFDDEDGSVSIDQGRYSSKVDLARDLVDTGCTVWAVGNGHNDVPMVEVAQRSFMVPNRDDIDYTTLGAEPVEREELPARVREGGMHG